MEKEKIVSTIVKGTIIGASSFAAMTGFKYGSKLFERVVPSSVNKIKILGGLAVSLTSNGDDDDEETE